MRLIKATMASVEEEIGNKDEPYAFTEADFDEAFAEFDKDGNGTISRGEMVAFIKKTAGL